MARRRARNCIGLWPPAERGRDVRRRRGARGAIHFRQVILKSVLEVHLGSRTGDEEDARLFQRVSAFLDDIFLTMLEPYP